MTSPVLLTGGAGFIGAALAHRLAADGAEIWVYDNLHPQVHGPDAEPPALPATVTFRRGDVRDADRLAAVVSDCRPRAIVHLAAETGTGQSATARELFRTVNVEGTRNLLAATKRAGLALDRLILPSSRAVYGEGPYRNPAGEVVVPPPRREAYLAAGRFEPGDGALVAIPARETTPPAPCSVYAETKLEQERLALEASGSTAILRLQNVYGPGQSLKNPYAGIVSIFLQQARQKERFDIYEDGRVTRDFIFVDDVVDAFRRALAADLSPGAVLNIGSGRRVTLIDVAHTMAGLLGLPRDAVNISGRYRTGDVRHACADIAAARQQLGWAPSVGLHAGLAAFVDWAGA